ncbi:hypothetical protein SAMD00019534_086370 [Acytostelium subglobosum LB1]|uniref:hypothetical protein n=1 Tax=Acytostelium subglobosum LB1 TaxID=1410327 RepID=UPI0006449C6F|nr:hypothetical protein SAMD00019534_086370 [Acytostelium subglobosum LB1]GAM25462.1 hypothetical protein SAMD00019534_086370 [Acytostelium subglobosum LB1]|eukprot:XP_012751448.1 hypothetical protein SAMD00019534_086370 [Acytostelium subglobosum LB1]
MERKASLSSSMRVKKRARRHSSSDHEASPRERERERKANRGLVRRRSLSTKKKIVRRGSDDDESGDDDDESGSDSGSGSDSESSSSSDGEIIESDDDDNDRAPKKSNKKSTKNKRDTKSKNNNNKSNNSKSGSSGSSSGGSSRSGSGSSSSGSDSESDDDSSGLDSDELNNLTCSNCKTGADDDKILLCDTDGCGRGYHTYCLRYKLEEIPKGKWVCDHCRWGDLSDVNINTEEDEDEDLDVMIRRKRMSQTPPISSITKTIEHTTSPPQQTPGSGSGAGMSVENSSPPTSSKKSSPPMTKTSPVLGSSSKDVNKDKEKEKKKLSSSASNTSTTTTTTTTTSSLGNSTSTLPKHPPSMVLKKPSMSKSLSHSSSHNSIPGSGNTSSPSSPMITGTSPMTANPVNNNNNNGSNNGSNVQSQPQPQSQQLSQSSHPQSPPVVAQTQTPTQPLPQPQPQPQTPQQHPKKAPSIVNEKRLLKSPAASSLPTNFGGTQLVRAGSKEEIDPSFSILDMVPNSKSTTSINNSMNISWDLGGGYSSPALSSSQQRSSASATAPHAPLATQSKAHPPPQQHQQQHHPPPKQPSPPSVHHHHPHSQTQVPQLPAPQQQQQHQHTTPTLQSVKTSQSSVPVASVKHEHAPLNTSTNTSNSQQPAPTSVNPNTSSSGSGSGSGQEAKVAKSELTNEVFWKGRISFDDMFVSTMNIIKLNDVDIKLNLSSSSLTFQRSQLQSLPLEVKQIILATNLQLNQLPVSVLLLQPFFSSVSPPAAACSDHTNGTSPSHGRNGVSNHNHNHSSNHSMKSIGATSTYYNLLLRLKRSETVGLLQVSSQKNLYIFAHQITYQESMSYGWICDTTMLFGIVHTSTDTQPVVGKPLVSTPTFKSADTKPSPSPSPSPASSSSHIPNAPFTNGSNNSNNNVITIKDKHICFLGYGDKLTSPQLVKSLLEAGAQVSNTLEADSNLFVIEPNYLPDLYQKHPRLIDYRRADGIHFIKGQEYLEHLVSKSSSTSSSTTSTTKPINNNNNNINGLQNAILYPQTGLIIVDNNMLIENDLLLKRLVPLLSNLKTIGKQWTIQVFKGALDELKSFSHQSSTIQQRLDDIMSHSNNSKLISIREESPKSAQEILSKSLFISKQFVYKHVILLTSNRILIEQSSKFPSLHCCDLKDINRYMSSLNNTNKV